jgi:sulfur carrier protein
MQLQLNGEAREIPDGTTLADLLKLLDLSTEGVAVELNTRVVRKALHAETSLTAGDRVEIVAFVGGG